MDHSYKEPWDTRDNWTSFERNRPSLTYAPALIVLLVLGVFHAQKRPAARFSLLAAAGVYALALVFRMLDEVVCPALPIGTHFLWHSLSGLIAYLAMRSVILSRASPVGPVA